MLVTAKDFKPKDFKPGNILLVRNKPVYLILGIEGSNDLGSILTVWDITSQQVISALIQTREPWWEVWFLEENT